MLLSAVFIQSMCRISDMHDVHVGDLDLNLLIALRALISERHVTRAAARVKLTQPAMSHTLARLRSALGDPILVRTRSGMMLTARAQELAEPLERIMTDVGRLLAPSRAFDPALATRGFRVATTDYVELVLMPSVLERAWTEAPNVNVQLRALVGNGPDDLDEDRIDVVLAPIALTGGQRGSLLAQRIMTERFVCVVREDHPRVGKRLTLDRFLELPHALITPRGAAGGIVDTALAKLGKRRRIAAEVPHFLVAPFLIEKTDLVLTVPERVAKALAPAAKIRLLAPPPELDIPGFDISLFWHQRYRADPAHEWFRRVITGVAKKI